ncbi:hypothetical protein PVL29_005088 [Vitis rotundifolia]|uniref:Uncharacterized protein n=1 Tax=Vitis rotundifolia TaxID=103349 RepID=A0AA39AAT2_VITRO|nr:hypothetical protein PVL29_005088 [Vitis rotundifolia]
MVEEKVEEEAKASQEEAKASQSESSMGLHPHGKMLSSYLGLSFSLFLLSTLHLKLLQAEQELVASIVEIFVSHREAWHREKKHMVDQIHTVIEEIACLRAKVEELERSEEELKARLEELTREVGEREEILHEPIKFPSIFFFSFSLIF